MRKWITLTLIGALLLCLCGCPRDGIKEAVTFYYPRQYEALKLSPEDGAIDSEQREASGHTGDLRYLLSLYLRGPLDESLESPFPAGCQLMDVQLMGGTMTVTLNAVFAQLENLDLTTACVCLSKTCLSLADVEEVHIKAVGPDDASTVNVTLRAEDLLLEDDYDLSQLTPTEGTQ